MINVNIDNIENEFLNQLSIDDFYNTNEYCNLFSVDLNKLCGNIINEYNNISLELDDSIINQIMNTVNINILKDFFNCNPIPCCIHDKNLKYQIMFNVPFNNLDEKFIILFKEIQDSI